MRSLAEIATTGAAWVTEAELAALVTAAHRSERTGKALEDAVRFIRDYPLGCEDRAYEQRRNEILCSEVIREWLGTHSEAPS